MKTKVTVELTDSEYSELVERAKTMNVDPPEALKRIALFFADGCTPTPAPAQAAAVAPEARP